MKPNPSVRFQSLDALRFCAFLIVFFSHLPSLKNILPALDFIHIDGSVGVIFFFVLSGFLITNLLLEERKAFNNINLRYFYIRRILRIWPLYYIIVFLAYIVQPLIDNSHNANAYTPSWPWTIFFFENIRMLTEDKYPDATLTMLWSLCVEEHFYLLWPVIIKYCSLKKFPYILLLFVCVGILARLLQVLFLKNQTVHNVDVFSSFDLFALGGAVAYITSFKSRFLQQIAKINPLLKGTFLIITLLCILFPGYIFAANATNSVLRPLFLGLIFVGVLLIFLPANNTFTFKENNILSKLGKLSYGLYMYHIIIINALFMLFSRFAWNNTSGLNGITISCLSFILSVIVSYISYNLIEKPVLHYRKYFVRMKVDAPNL